MKRDAVPRSRTAHARPFYGPSCWRRVRSTLLWKRRLHPLLSKGSHEAVSDRGTGAFRLRLTPGWL
jgi:hypothetical protein